MIDLNCYAGKPLFIPVFISYLIDLIHRVSI